MVRPAQFGARHVCSIDPAHEDMTGFAAEVGFAPAELQPSGGIWTTSTIPIGFEDSRCWILHTLLLQDVSSMEQRSDASRSTDVDFGRLSVVVVLLPTYLPT